MNLHKTVTFIDLGLGDDPMPFLIVISNSLPQYCEPILFNVYFDEYKNGDSWTLGTVVMEEEPM